MEIRDAERIRTNWGDRYCGHPHTEKERDRGAATGDYVCTQCGRVVELDDIILENEG